MKSKFLILALSLLMFSCQEEKPASTEDKGKAKADSLNLVFDTFKNTFIEKLWETYPDWATGSGYHKFDSVMVIPNAAYREKKAMFCKETLSGLESFDTLLLNPNNLTDYALIKNQLKSSLWYQNHYKSYEWDPASYNVSGTFAEILSSRHAILDEKLRTLYLKMKNIGAYYEAGKAELKKATKEHLDLAIVQNEGALVYFDKTLRDSLQKSELGEHEKQQFEARLNESVSHIEGYLHWLKTDLKKRLDKEGYRDFRIGNDLYTKKFKYDIQSGYTAEVVYEKAIKTKEETLVKMEELAKQLWPKHMGAEAMPTTRQELIKRLINKLSENHVKREDFIASIEKQIPELVDFINQQQLIYLDPKKPLVVRETPLYMRGGGAGASISAPGPYDANGNTYYNVTPLDDYDAKQAESYLREYNFYILQILNIHEAIPGHYTQLVYSNQSPSLIKSILGNGAMIEGWAVYTERMMLESGYGNQSTELWFMYYKWFLRVVCNTILDYSVHTQGWNEEQAMNLLMNDAFQEEAEAKGKWKRCTLTQVQLCSYFTGFSEIYDLREEVKTNVKDQFNLKEFHETFLSYGSAPVGEIKKLMMNKK